MKIQIPVSDKCNLKCFMCGAHEPWYKINLPPKVYTEIVDLEPDIERLWLGGCEPFMEPEKLNWWIDRFPREKLGVITNATLPRAFLYYDMFGQFEISWDSVDPKIYKSIRGAEMERVVRFVSLVNNTKRGQKLGRKDKPILSFNSIMMRRTFQGVVDLYHAVRDLGAAIFIITPLRNQRGDEATAMEMLDLSEKTHLDGFIKQIQEEAARDGIRVVDRINTLPETCRMWDGVWIHQDGKMGICCGQDKEGDLWKETIRDFYDRTMGKRLAIRGGDRTGCKGASCTDSILE